MRAFALSLALVSLAGCKSGSQSSPAGVATYLVHRRTGPIALDGLLTEAAWDKAEKAMLVRSIDGRPAAWATEARLLWDDEKLYVGFLAQDKNISTPFKKDDEPLYTSNVVEIFLNPKGDLARYFEIEVSPANVLFDCSFTGRRQGADLAWSSRTQHAVHLDGTLNDSSDVDRGWSAELAIPFAALDGARPKAGDEWRFNLFRLLQGSGQPNEGQAYSAPLVGDFHAVNRFAVLKFAE